MDEVNLHRLIAVVAFAGTYLGLALGRLPFLRVDRTGVAIIGGALVVVSGVLPWDWAVAAVDAHTIVLLFGMMIVAAYLRLSGFFRLATYAAVRRAHPNALLIIAPRKPERFAEAEALARGDGFRVMRRRELGVDAEPRAEVVILDTIGELAHLFQVATVVFVGGSLVDQGGHNILEPAVHGKPIVYGPHMQNFAEIADAFLKNQAAVQVAGPAELSGTVVRLLGDSVERARLGAAARALVEANRGAKPRTLEAITALLPPRGSRAVLPFRR